MDGLRIEDFEVGKEIGKGGFGVVYEATHPIFKKVALKKITTTGVPFSRIRAEYEALKNVKHSSVVKYFGNFKSGSYHYLVLELCEHGSVREYVKKNGPFSEPSAAYILKQLVCAVQKCHQEGIMHRDLSAGNILISAVHKKDDYDLPRVKICDFGLAKDMKDGAGVANTIAGTPGFMAPEMRLGNGYKESVDVYSLGAALYTMLTGSDPPQKETPPLHRLSDAASALVKRMMMAERDRISLNEVLRCEFMTMGLNNCGEGSRYVNSGSADARGTSVERRNYEADGDRFSRGTRAPSYERRAVALERGRDQDRRSADLERRYSHEREQQPVYRESRPLHRERGDWNNLPRTASQPPVPTDPARTVSRGHESGFGSGSDTDPSLRYPSGQAGLYNGMPIRPRSQMPSGANGIWPLSVVRLADKSFTKAKFGRIRVTGNSLMFDKENGKGLVDTVMEVRLNGDLQTVYFHMPIRSVPVPKEDKCDVPYEKVHRDRYTAFALMNPADRDAYNCAKNLLAQLKSQTDKVILRRPAEFPWAAAKLMENGDLRITPMSEVGPNEKFVRKQGAGGKIVFRHLQGSAPPTDVTCPETLNRMRTVYEFLTDLEALVTRSLQKFPFTMLSGASIPAELLQSRTVSAAVPSTQRMMSHASAPATLQYARTPSVQRQPLAALQQRQPSAANQNPLHPYQIKRTAPNDPNIIVHHTTSGASMRISTANPDEIIYRRNHGDGKTEQRFDRRDKNRCPPGASDMFDILMDYQRQR